MRASGAAHAVDFGGWEHGWLLTGYDATVGALVDPRLRGVPPQARAPQGGSGELLDEEDLFFLPDPQHERLRRLIGGRLTPRRVAELAPRIQHEIDTLLDGLPPGEPVDFVTEFAVPLPVAVLCELLGVPPDGRRYVGDYMLGWLAESGAGVPVTESAGVALAGYLTALIAERRARPRTDLISAMTSVGTDDDILSAVRLLLIAGHHPVTRLLGGGLEVLLRHRSLWTRLAAEPELSRTTVEELLRLITPAMLATRYSQAGAELNGEPLAEGTPVHCALVAANRDPGPFPAPDTFDPDRPAHPHLAFGLGHKHCLGAALARSQMRMVIDTMAARFPRMALTSTPAGAPDGHPFVVLDPTAAGE
ncbi:cytochrome P450 [Krasilnikovia sp. MM14-A1004]